MCGDGPMSVVVSCLTLGPWYHASVSGRRPVGSMDLTSGNCYSRFEGYCMHGESAVPAGFQLNLKRTLI